MKKILFILSVALLTVGCNDKEEFTPAKGATPINVSLTYDNASSFASNAMNRTLIYEQNGQQIKLSIVADEDDILYHVVARRAVRVVKRDLLHITAFAFVRFDRDAKPVHTAEVDVFLIARGVSEVACLRVARLRKPFVRFKVGAVALHAFM